MRLAGTADPAMGTMGMIMRMETTLTATHRQPTRLTAHPATCTARAATTVIHTTTAMAMPRRPPPPL